MGSKLQQKYENLRVDDRDDRSSTEVESLMDGEKQWHDVDLSMPMRRPTTKFGRICAALNSWRWLIDTTLLLIILGVVVRTYMLKPALNPYDFGGDITGFEPRCE